MSSRGAYRGYCAAGCWFAWGWSGGCWRARLSCAAGARRDAWRRRRRPRAGADGRVCVCVCVCVWKYGSEREEREGGARARLAAACEGRVGRLSLRRKQARMDARSHHERRRSQAGGGSGQALRRLEHAGDGRVEAGDKADSGSSHGARSRGLRGGGCWEAASGEEDAELRRGLASSVAMCRQATGDRQGLAQAPQPGTSGSSRAVCVAGSWLMRMATAAGDGDGGMRRGEARRVYCVARPRRKRARW